MNIEDVVVGLRKELDHRFGEAGFRFRKTNREYVRSKYEVHHIYRIETHAMTGWYLVTPCAFVGSSSINSRFNEIIGKTLSPTRPTCGFAIRNLNDQDRGSYRVELNADVISAAESIWRDFVDIAKPFFENVGHLRGIDKYLNSEKNARPAAGSVSGACKGLIAANLVGNPRFDQLASEYEEFWAQAQSPEIAADIGRVRKALEGSKEHEKA